MEIPSRATSMWVVGLSTVRMVGMEPSVILDGIREQHRQHVTKWDTLIMVRAEHWHKKQGLGSGCSPPPCLWKGAHYSNKYCDTALVIDDSR